MKNNYLYILIRKDLSHSQKIVQASHITWEVCKKNGIESHPNVIILGIKDEYSLLKQLDFLTSKKLEVHKFHEPDLDNRLSGIGTFVSDPETRTHFKKFQLIKDLDFLNEREKHIMLKKQCIHKNTKSDYVETLGFEYTPKKVCSFCKKIVGELSVEEQKELYVRFWSNLMEEEPTEDQIEKNHKGFNV